MSRIGILGGTFSPIHNGHIYIAQEALHALDLSEVWFVVAGIPPHKDADGGASAFARYEMCRLAVEGKPGLSVKDFELYDLTKSYTAGSLSNLKERFPQHEFFFIMGEDSALSFHSWRQPEVISSLATILVAARCQEDEDRSPEAEKQLTDCIERLNRDFPGEFIRITDRTVHVSSTQVREILRQGDFEKVSHLIPPAVVSYIREHRIYGEAWETDYEAIRGQLRSVLKDSRYHHSLRVADTAAALALVHIFPQSVAYTAGLIHDCAKYFSGEELLSYCEKQGLHVSDLERESSYLLHGPVGAHMARGLYGIEDEEILESVRTHTTGEPAMSLLQKIIFTADYIEPERSRSPRLTPIRDMAYRDLDRAVLMILEETFDYLKETGRPVDPKAKEAYEYYLDLISKKG